MCCLSFSVSVDYDKDYVVSVEVTFFSPPVNIIPSTMAGLWRRGLHLDEQAALEHLLVLIEGFRLTNGSDFCFWKPIKHSYTTNSFMEPMDNPTDEVSMDRNAYCQKSLAQY